MERTETSSPSLPPSGCAAESLGFILGLYGDNGKENGNYRDYRGYLGILRVYIGVIWG